MAEAGGKFVEKLKLIGKASEDQYFRKLDQALIDAMHQNDEAEVQEDQRLHQRFAKLLVAVDLSPSSRSALQYAADIAELMGSSIIILHVLHQESMAMRVIERHAHEHATPENPLESDAFLGELLDRQRAEGYAELQAFVPSSFVKYPVELRVVFGHPAEQIVECAEAEKVDLVMMGTHGRTGFKRWVAGSVAERVVRTAHCTVLTVRQRE